MTFEVVMGVRVKEAARERRGGPEFILCRGRRNQTGRIYIWAQNEGALVESSTSKALV